MSSRRSPTITKATLGRLSEFVRDLGVTVHAVDFTPSKVRILTTSAPITLSADDDAELDKELAEHRKRHGYD